MPEAILFEKAGGLAWVTLNRGRPAPPTEVGGIRGRSRAIHCAGLE